MTKRRRHFESMLKAAAAAALLFAAFSPSYAQTSSDLTDLREKVRNGTEEEKRQALYDLRVIGTEEAARAAIPGLNDMDEVVRATAAGVVVTLPPDEAATALRPLLSDKKSFVRKEACLAIGKARATAAAADVTRVLQKDDKPDVRAAAATALGLIGDPASVSALLAAIEKRGGSKNAYLRREAAFAIGRIAESSVGSSGSSTFPESFLPLKYKTGSDHQPTGFRSAIPTLVRLLTAEKEPAEVRRAAAYALGAIGADSARSEIERCSGSEDPYLSETCREALAKLQS